ncbi:MAG: DUF2281 domain-containing protein [Verrucomicrobia bacterium]|nr:DUF2281 domain-containing protein [Verrucomicrobiota bacterium]
MSTFTVILEPSADGTLHLPVPAEWRHQTIRVRAELEPVDSETKAAPVSTDRKGSGWFNGEIQMSPKAPKPGCLQGFRMAADFDAPLEDFKEYTA